MKKKITYTLLTLFTIIFMVGASEILHEKEIIFPEITALLIGGVVAPKRSWQTSRIRMIILIAICSVTGIVFVRFIPLPLIAKIPFAFLICQLILVFSKTTFAPLISATILPILMGTESIIYPLSAVGFTVLIIIEEWIIIKLHIKEEEHFIPRPLPKYPDFFHIFLRVIPVLLATIIVIPLDFSFCIAPPLLVAFTEFSNPSCKAREHYIKTIMVITLCGLFGVLSRYIFTITLGLPLTLSAVVAALTMLLVITLSKSYLPPVGAITILPMIIPAEGLATYPVQIFLGAAVFMGISLILFKSETTDLQL